jgi:hypothetical protein
MKKLIALILALIITATVGVMPVSAQDEAAVTEVAEAAEVMSVSDYRNLL